VRTFDLDSKREVQTRIHFVMPDRERKAKQMAGEALMEMHRARWRVSDDGKVMKTLLRPALLNMLMRISDIVLQRDTVNAEGGSS
jgi:hypothetical protein